MKVHGRILTHIIRYIGIMPGLSFRVRVFRAASLWSEAHCRHAHHRQYEQRKVRHSLLLVLVVKFSSRTKPLVSSAAGNSATAASIFLHQQRNVHECRVSTGPPARRLARPVSLSSHCRNRFLFCSTRNSFQRRLFQGQHQRHRSRGRTLRYDQRQHVYLHSRD